MGTTTINRNTSPHATIAPTPSFGTSIIRRALVAAGLFGIAVIHLADLPDKMAEVPYLGWAYIGLIGVSLMLAELVITAPTAA